MSLELRKQIKRKKPKFVMQDSHKLSRLTKKWKRPRGIDSKIRLNLKGYSKAVQVGYGSPKSVKGLHNSGLFPILISNIKELSNIDKEKQGIILSSTIGNKKKKEIITKAIESSIKILNLDPDSFLKNIETNLQQRKAEKEKRKKKKTEKKAKKVDKKDQLADKVLSEEEKTEQEKKEKDKLLTKKEAL